MAKMRAVDAAMYVLEKEGITTAFGVPGAAINPFYSAMRKHGGIRHILARHVEGASHMAEGYTRATAGNIGVCLGTSGPAGTDMITALYSASADSIPILCITGQAPRARLHKEDFQAVDIEAIAKPVSKMAVTVREAALVPRVLQQAFHLMRSGRPGPVLVDLPFDVQVAEIEFDPDMYEPLPVYKPAASRMQIEKAVEMLIQAERPVIVAGGGVINADAAVLLQQFAELTSIPVIPTLMGWGCIPDDHELMAGMVGLQTAHRYGNATLLASDMVFGIGNRFANRHTGSVEKYTEGRKIVHIDIEPTQIGRVLCPDLGIVSDAKAALTLLVEVAQEMQKAGRLPCRKEWVADCQQRKRTLLRKTHFDNVPVKPQRVYEEMNKAFGRDVCYVTTIGLSQIAAAQMLHVFKDRHWINCGQAGPLGWTIPAALGVCAADPERNVVAISGDFDFQFLFIMVPDTPQVEDVLFGENGCTKASLKGKTIVDMSSISPIETKRFARQVNELGGDYLDAPVSGGEIGAREGTLSIMVGGDEAVFERVKPLFELLGKNITLVGGNGDGQTCKVANQIIVALNIEAVSEALLFASKAGADPVRVRQALMGGFASSRILEVHGERMIKRTFNPGFKIALHQKDLNLALQSAKALALNLPNTATCQELFNTCAANGGSQLDHSALVQALELMANHKLA
ncbi:TPA: glyoxylate carboligase [Escherichia coli]|nr:glyoxylate carboligase [Escherichia coli]HDY1846107.1 glyoxylate carboligase [Escherichia coli]